MNLDLDEVGDVDMDFDRGIFSSSSEEVRDTGDVEEAEVMAYGGKISWKDVTGLSEILSGGRSVGSLASEYGTRPLNQTYRHHHTSKTPLRYHLTSTLVSICHMILLEPSGIKRLGGL